MGRTHLFAPHGFYSFGANFADWGKDLSYKKTMKERLPKRADGNYIFAGIPSLHRMARFTGLCKDNGKPYTRFKDRRL